MERDTTHHIKEIPVLLRKLYDIVEDLEGRFDRKFTPDGHLVGSVGEIMAAYLYGLTLLPASVVTHDAKAQDGRMVQIKATQGKSVALRAEPQHLIVLSIGQDGTPAVEYNGPGKSVWDKCGKMQKNGQRPIGLSRLAKLMRSVNKADQLTMVRTWPS